MRGEVLYYDETQGFGFLHGADGNRYTFTAEDMRRLMPMEKGTVVEFQPTGDKARDIFSIRAPAGNSPATTAPAVPVAPAHFGRLAGSEAAALRPTSLWAYFRRALTENYASFAGRARRKEYWGFCLFWFLAFAALCAIGLIADGAAGNLDGGEAPYLTLAAAGLFMLATILPGMAITIRRIHDIGLSGWFYLLILVPSVGGLIIFVFSLIPSQKNDNKWGPLPEGIRT